MRIILNSVTNLVVLHNKDRQRSSFKAQSVFVF